MDGRGMDRNILKYISFLIWFLPAIAHAYSPPPNCAADGTRALTYATATNAFACTTFTTGSTGSGTAGQVAYYQSAGTSVIGTSSILISGTNVGIGTNLPSNKLDVAGNMTIGYTSGLPPLQSSNVLTANGQIGATTFDTGNYYQGHNTSNRFFIDAGNDIVALNRGTDNKFTIGLGTTLPIVGTTATISGNGTGNGIGIGTATISNTFDVNGAVAIGTPGTAAQANGLLVQGNTQLNNFLQFAGTTASFPAFKRSGTQIQTRLGDDSNYGDFSARDIQANQNLTVAATLRFLSVSRINAPSDGILELSNNAVSDFTRLQFGGTTSSFPAIARSTTSLVVQAADGTAAASVGIGTTTTPPTNGLAIGGQILSNSGSASPGFSFVDSTNTGIGENSQGRIGFYTGGTLLAQFNSTTLVLSSGTGFDATAGSFAIHSTNDSAPNGRMDFLSNGGTIRGSVTANASDLLLSAALGGGASANEGVSIIARGTGGIGIGTSGLTPRNSSMLDVQGGLNVTGTVNIAGIASSSAAQTGTLCWTTGTGNVTVDTTTTCLLSSLRFKKNIQPIGDALTKISQMRPITFVYKDPVMGQDRLSGLIAEEVFPIDKTLVEIDKEGRPYKVRYEGLTVLNTKAIQQLMARVGNNTFEGAVPYHKCKALGFEFHQLCAD